MMDEIHMDFLNLKAILLCLVLCNRIGPCISSPFASWKVLKFISKQHSEKYSRRMFSSRYTVFTCLLQ